MIQSVRRKRGAWTDLPRFAWVAFAVAAVLGLTASVFAVGERDVMALAWFGQALVWTGFAVVAFQGRRRRR